MRIRELREAEGITQTALASRMGVSRQAVNQWETGAVWPSAQILPDLAAALGCSIDELYEGGPDQRGVEDAAPYTQDHFTQEATL